MGILKIRDKHDEAIFFSKKEHWRLKSGDKMVVVEHSVINIRYEDIYDAVRQYQYVVSGYTNVYFFESGLEKAKKLNLPIKELVFGFSKKGGVYMFWVPLGTQEINF